MFAYLLANGIDERELLWFVDNPCPPTVIGLNYYLTSDRFLDHRLSNYPDWMAGGDTGAEPLVDVEAVRVRKDGIAGAGSILTEAWNRYKIPVAITECHLGGGQEGDPVRWLAEVWAEAQQARARGADVAAVTVWSLLGSWDWCSLVTCDNGVYEPGVFDIRSGHPVPTPVAAAVRQLAQGQPLQPTEKAGGASRSASPLSPSASTTRHGPRAHAQLGSELQRLGQSSSRPLPHVNARNSSSRSC